MGQRQREAIAQAISGLMAAGDGGETLCCTIEARNSAGEDVSVQVMQDSVNISPYAFQDDPLSRLEDCGASEGIDEDDIELVDWEAGKFATIGTEELGLDEVVRLVDGIFTRLLNCDEESYVLSAATEDLA